MNDEKVFKEKRDGLGFSMIMTSFEILCSQSTHFLVLQGGKFYLLRKKNAAQIHLPIVLSE